MGGSHVLPRKNKGANFSPRKICLPSPCCRPFDRKNIPSPCAMPCYRIILSRVLIKWSTYTRTGPSPMWMYVVMQSQVEYRFRAPPTINFTCGFMNVGAQLWPRSILASTQIPVPPGIERRTFDQEISSWTTRPFIYIAIAQLGCGQCGLVILSHGHWAPL